MSLIAALALFVGGNIQLFAQTNTVNPPVLYYTCPMHPSVKSDKPGSCPFCGMGLIPVYPNPGALTNAPSNGTNNITKVRPKHYPLDTCIVDGMKLGSMGAPYVFVYQGQEIKLCCPDCKPAFLKDPKKYLKKIQDAKGKK